MTYFGKIDEKLAITALEYVDNRFIVKYIKYLRQYGKFLKPLSWLPLERSIEILEEIDDSLREEIMQAVREKDKLLTKITDKQIERYKREGNRRKLNYIATPDFLAILPDSALGCGHCGQQYKVGEHFHFLCPKHTEHNRQCPQWASFECDLCWPIKPGRALSLANYY